MAAKAAETGAGPIAMVAVEQFFPKDRRIIDDDLAEKILPLSARVMARLMRPPVLRDWMVRLTEKTYPGLWGGMMCRKRYIDEMLIATAGKMQAVVNLGAGFDTRAYRLPVLETMPIWELDQPENINPKRERLQRLFGAVPSHVALVAIDFDRDEPATVLASHGYSRDKTFFIWEAVTQYLQDEGVRKVFDVLTTAVPGSRLAFTYVRKDFISGRNLCGQERLYDQYIVKNRTWRFGLSPEDVAIFLDPYGWRLIEHLGYEELATRYVQPTGRTLASTPIERMVYAEKL